MPASAWRRGKRLSGARLGVRVNLDKAARALNWSIEELRRAMSFLNTRRQTRRTNNPESRLLLRVTARVPVNRDELQRMRDIINRLLDEENT